MGKEVLEAEKGGEDVGYLCRTLGDWMDQRSTVWLPGSVEPLKVIMADMRPVAGIVWVFSSHVQFPGFRWNKGVLLDLMSMRAVVSPSKCKVARRKQGLWRNAFNGVAVFGRGFLQRTQGKRTAHVWGQWIVGPINGVEAPLGQKACGNWRIRENDLEKQKVLVREWEAGSWDPGGVPAMDLGQPFTAFHVHVSHLGIVWKCRSESVGLGWSPRFCSFKESFYLFIFGHTTQLVGS